MSRLIPAALTGLALLVAPVKADALTTDGVMFYQDGGPIVSEPSDPKVRKEWHMRTIRAMFPTYQVQVGETLSGIAQKLTGDPKNYIVFMRFNELEKPEHLRVGELFLLEAFDVIYRGQKVVYEWNKETRKYDKFDRAGGLTSDL